MPGNRFRSQLKKIGNKTGHCLRTAAWQTCKCLMWTVCSPCICCIILVLPNRSVARESRVPMEPPKPMLPSPRRRALTLPSTDFQERQITLDQTKSAFMTKLPLEIRRMIYGMALGEDSIHLSLEDGSLKARRCSITTCICYLRPHGVDYKLQLALPLLRTCRRIYSEAIEYLYSANLFFISTEPEDYPTAGYLPYFLLPQRIAQITRLTIDWDLDRHQAFQVSLTSAPHRDDWYRTWDVLGRMTGLRRLHMRFYFFLDLWQQCYGDFWENNGKELLEPIKKVTSPKDFVITLPSWRCSTDFDIGQSKCVFRLPGEPIESSP